MNGSRPKVYITNKSAHDFSQAERYGTIEYITLGRLSKYAVNQMHREVEDVLRDSTEHDYLLLTSLTVLNCIASSILATKHGVVNYLIHKNNGYVIRRVTFNKE